MHGRCPQYFWIRTEKKKAAFAIACMVYYHIMVLLITFWRSMAMINLKSEASMWQHHIWSHAPRLFWCKMGISRLFKTATNDATAMWSFCFNGSMVHLLRLNKFRRLGFFVHRTTQFVLIDSSSLIRPPGFEVRTLKIRIVNSGHLLYFYEI
jgi:hypothetical protein